MLLNASAQKKFDCSTIDSIPLIKKYPIWKKMDPFGRDYYGVSNFWGMDANIKEGSDLSWLEWDGNEINIDSKVSNEIRPLFWETVGIMKSWQAQLQDYYPNDRFVILASFDDGSQMEENEAYQTFTLRFWKTRAGHGPEEDTEYDEPVLKMIVND
ncbi:hypothetical protein JS518_02425 [Clostridiales bacterium FE2010]|nr:hypothetical protein JS518_02425 [Clostridiales bacterium FE2010]